MNEEIKKENTKKRNSISFEDGLGFVFGVGLAWILGASGIIPFIIIISLGALVARKMLKSDKTYIRVIFFLLLIVSFFGGIIMKEVYKDMRQDSFVSSSEEEQYQQIETDKNPKNEEIIGNLYRNKKYGFRIKFPENWTIEVGDGEHIVQKAVSRNGDTISVLVFQFDTGNQEGFKSIKDSGTVDEFVTSSIDGVRDKFNDIKVLDYGETKIDNQPAYWVEYSFTYSALDITINATNLVYYVAKGDTMYSINAGTESSQYLKAKGDILSSVGTFVLEN